MTALEQQRPLLAKPVATATRAGAGHTLAAVLNLEGLQQLLLGAVEELQLPVVLQEFVPHGPALFKVGFWGVGFAELACSSASLEQTAGSLVCEVYIHITSYYISASCYWPQDSWR